MPSNEPPPPPTPIPSARPQRELTTLGVLLVLGGFMAAVLLFFALTWPYFRRREARVDGEQAVIKAHYEALAELERERVLAAGRPPVVTSSSITVTPPRQ